MICHRDNLSTCIHNGKCFKYVTQPGLSIKSIRELETHLNKMSGYDPIDALTAVRDVRMDEKTQATLDYFIQRVACENVK